MQRVPGDEAGRGGEGGRSYPAAAAVALLAAAGLSLLSGCSAPGGAGRMRPAVPVAAAEPPAVVAPEPRPQPAGASVVRLSGGREGFVISERASLDSESRAEFERGTALVREARYEGGIDLLEKVVVRAPEASAPRINLAIAYRQVRKPAQAEAHLKKALELIPGHPLASNEYGLLLREAGRFSESRRVYERSLEAFPEYHPIHRNLGILCDLYLRDPACAVEQYGHYEKKVPGDGQVKLWLADLANRANVAPTAAAPAGNVISMSRH